jgi:adenylosuccinate lyase
VVQRNAMEAWKRRTSFLDLLKQDDQVVERLGHEGLEELFDYGYYTRYAGELFERAGLG